MHEHFRRCLWMNIGIILGSFLVFGIVFYFFSQALNSKVAQVLVNRAAIAQRSINLETLSGLKTDIAAAMEFQKKIDSLLPPQDNLISFPQFLNAMARSHSLSSTFNFDGVPNPALPPAPGYVDFSVAIEGDAANIRSFVDELESKTTKFMVNLQGFVLTPRSSGVYHVELKGRVFFQENRMITT